jgi:hypothetical protein
VLVVLLLDKQQQVKIHHFVNRNDMSEHTTTNKASKQEKIKTKERNRKPNMNELLLVQMSSK